MTKGHCKILVTRFRIPVLVPLINVMFSKEVGFEMKVTLCTMLHNVHLQKLDLIALQMGVKMGYASGGGSQRIVIFLDLMCVRFLKNFVESELFLLETR
ncbi:hypothetical protein FF2_002395 [Malus domestica]